MGQANHCFRVTAFFPTAQFPLHRQEQEREKAEARTTFVMIQENGRKGVLGGRTDPISSTNQTKNPSRISH